jgi:FSR family fosmidomycin resistance protein-like MFS transporter
VLKRILGEVTMKYRLVSFLSLGHLVTDMTQGAIPVMLPFLIAEHHLSYAAAAGIVFASTVVSSLIQPLLGYFADKFSKPWFIPAGVLFAGLGIALVGIVPTYHLILIVVVLSGIGLAAYHPEAARTANFVAAENKATAMSLFGIGGQAGFAIGPVLTTGLLIWLGLKGTLLLALPAVFVGIFLALQVPRFSAYTKSSTNKTGTAQSAERDEWPSFLRLSGVVFCRSIIFYTMNTFIPLYWINVLHQSNAAGGAALTLLFAAGVVGNLIGGRLADTLGLRTVVRGGFFAFTIILPLFVWTQNVLVATLLLVVVGLIHFMTYSPLVVMGQMYLPNHVGFASGVTFGLAVTIGGVTSPLLGLIADHHGIRTALWCVAFLPVLATGFALTLPHPRKETLATR